MTKLQKLEDKIKDNYLMNKDLIHHLAYCCSLPIELKIGYSKQRIKQFYESINGEVYISFSGGKDSTVLYHLIKSMYPDIKSVFFNTGLEYPEIVDFVNKFDDVIHVRPKRTFKDIIEQYGYPIISKEVAQKLEEIRTTKSDKLYNKRINGDHNGNGKLPIKYRFLIDAPFKISKRCCDYLKKQPAHKFEKETGLSPYIGTMVSDSQLRRTTYIQNGGCNHYSDRRNISTPLSFWSDQDIWDYIKQNDIPYCKIYDMGYKNTGCAFCGFGCHLEQDNKFKLMINTHPKLYDYCMNKLGMAEVFKFMESGLGNKIL
jgi:3'-phosphoadenosine 5'-phosphosulfate sulfotransferase (PAPS reductase)/FAD synthetase